MKLKFSPMLTLLKLLIGVYLGATACQNTYVVHTSDNKLHFITQSLQTHQLRHDLLVKMVEDEGGPIQRIENSVMHQLRAEIGLPPADTGNSVQLASRIDRICVSPDGVIEFFGRKLFIDELLAHPVVENGIYISASQEHHPTIINKTVIITATTKVSILDIFGLTSRVLRFSHVLYLSEVFQDIPRREDEVYLNGRWWRFESNVAAIYVLKEQNGLNFMLRVFDRSAIAVYKHRARKPVSRRLPVILICALAFSVTLYLNRNLRFGHCIIKHRLYTGRFVKKDCLIYRVSTAFLKEHRRVFGALKSHSIVNIFSETDGWMHPLIVTEMTSQFRPVRADDLDSTDQSGINGEMRSHVSRSEEILLRANDKEHQAAIRRFKDGLLAVVQSVEDIHSRETVHGRICPENVRVSADGQIKLQRILDGSGWRSVRQLKNIKSKGFAANESDDLFSLGCLLHFYLTGYHPFDLRNYVKKERRSFKRSERHMTADGARHNTALSDEAPIVDGSVDCATVNTNQQRKHRTLRVMGSLVFMILCRCHDLIHLGLHGMWSRFSTLCLCRCHDLIRLGLHRIWSRFSTVCLPVGPISTVSGIFKRVLGMWAWLSARRRALGVFEGPSPVPAEQIYSRTLSDEIIRYVEYNILYGTYRLRLNDQIEHDLIYHCFKSSAKGLQLKLACHPYFWDNHKCLEFICDASDFIETNSGLKPRVERNRGVVFTGSWMEYLDETIVRSASSKRSYDHQSICDLIRLIRNCHRHYQELKGGAVFEMLEGNLFFYLSSVFPELLMFLYRSPVLKGQLVLQRYYE